jgi:hypothetical protein
VAGLLRCDAMRYNAPSVRVVEIQFTRDQVLTGRYEPPVNTAVPLAPSSRYQGGAEALNGEALGV